MNLLNNTKWVALAQVIKVLCQIANLVILARLIPPDEYGLMAMAGVIVTLGFLFRDMGTSAAIIQKKELTDDLKNAVFWLNIIIGLILMLVIALSGPLAAHYFKQPELITVLALLSLTFPITSFSTSHLSLLERDSKFKKVALIESFTSLFATIIAITAAYQGFGVYSLVFQSLCNALLSSLLIVKASKWKPQINGYKYLKEINQIWRFGKNLVAFNFVNYFSRNADRWIIGRYMSSSILGAYDLAYKIMLFPLQTLTFVMSRSMLPILSQYQENDVEFNKVYLKSLKFITFFSIPLMMGMMLLREPFVDYVFGEKWHMVSGLLLWLAPTGILQSMNSTTGVVLTAKGKTNILFYTGIMCTVFYAIGFLVAINEDIYTFVEYYFYANVLAVGLNLAILFKVIKISFSKVLKELVPTILASLGMVSILLISQKYFESSLTFFLFQIILGVVVYFFCHFLMFKIFLKQLRV